MFCKQNMNDGFGLWNAQKRAAARLAGDCPSLQSHTRTNLEECPLSGHSSA